MLQNISGRERIASMILGGIAINRALRGSSSGVARAGLATVGASLLFRGASGHCPFYQKMDYNSKIRLPSHDAKPENSIIVNKPLNDVSSFLRESTLPFGSFFPGREENEFSARIGSDLWLLRLSASKDGKRTFVKRSVEADTLEPTLESGKAWVQAALAKLPLDEAFDLRKLRALIETGEIATVKGQSHGRRSGLGRAIEVIKGDAAPEKMQESVQPELKYATFQGVNI